MNRKNALDKLIDGILLAIDKKLNNAPYDKTYKGRITEIISEKKYKVSFNGNTYTAKSNNVHNVNDIVYVLVPQNNYKDLFIIN